MQFLPYLGCVWLGVESLRGGLAEGNRISETDFFDTLTIQNDQISHVKHVLAPLYVFFTVFGCWGGGGAPKGSRAQPAYAVFPPQQLKNGNF